MTVDRLEVRGEDAVPTEGQPPLTPPPPTQNESLLQTLQRAAKSNVRQYGMIVALVLIVIYFQTQTDGILLKPLNVTNLIMQNGYILILAIGMMMVIINGHIDLSVGSIAAFVGAAVGVMIVDWGLSWQLSLLAGIIIGGLIGAFQGYWIAYIGIPSFIVTLAGMLLFRGLALVMLNGQSIAPFPTGFRQMASGFIPDIAADDGLHKLTIALGIAVSVVLAWTEWRTRKRRLFYGLHAGAMSWFIIRIALLALVINAFTFRLAEYEGMPLVGILLISLIVIYSFLMNRSVMGRHIYAVGGNSKAAELSGIKTKRTTFWVFVNMGVLSALAGLIFVARLNAATPRAGLNFELDAIAAAFIGGASAAGGVGTVVGAIVGGLVMGVMNNGMSLLDVRVDWQQAIKGIVLLGAVAFDVYNKKRSK
jgi:putative multiple sugar transport system permease protein